MRSMKNYLKDVYIPEELTITKHELEEEHRQLYERFKDLMLEINPKCPESVIKAQYKKHFEEKIQ